MICQSWKLEITILIWERQNEKETKEGTAGG